ncbi:MAG TPA: hypothetical protein VGN01_21050 [Acidobacteriaceae bacterium]
MDPARLTAASFSRYPPQGRALAAAHLATLRRIPQSLLPVLLLQVLRYDYSFPAERVQLESQITALESSTPAAFQALMQPFAALELPPALVEMDWLNEPQLFTERLTAWLWSHQRIDAYHAAVEQYRQALPPPQPQTIAPRWTFVLIGRNAQAPARPLFRKLAPYGTLFTNVDPSGGTTALLAEASARATKYPVPFGHWYIDGSDPLPAPGLTIASYRRLVPAARKEFQLIRQVSSRPQTQPTVESVTSYVASLTPEMLGIEGTPYDPLRYFEVSILTQGAGCQIFSTTFVQWAARECLHRAQPLTLVARFADRQTAAPMEQMLNRDPLMQPQDTAGSLVDAEMGTYYTWINQGRLPGAEQSRFLAWWEDHNVALAISPSTAQGVTSHSPCTIPQILSWIA